MLFNSYIFILLFLPLCVVGYFGLNHFRMFKAAQVFLLIMSLWFYGYFNPGYLAIILCSVGINYVIYLLMNSDRPQALRKAVLILGLVINLGILVYFKYMDFFISTANSILKTDIGLLHVVLPLGISFFTFQQISFVIDAYRGEVADYDLLEYACFVTFFPQLIAGPIVTHDELVPQFMDLSKKSVDWDNLAKGIYIFTLGLAKKVLIADTFGNAANAGFATVVLLDSTNALLTMLAYTIQIYFDFSGYCDMAIGIGKMLNIDLPINFNSPYKALTITEFWDRWHMTLTRFFTRYVYIPLGGNRKGRLRTYINIFIVFFLSGFWHGAGFTFIIWGICHGLFSIITRHFKKQFAAMHPALSWLITFAFVNVMWVFFRADSIRDALQVIQRILVFDFGPIHDAILKAFQLPEFMMFINRLPIGRIYPNFMLTAFYTAAMLLLLGSRNAYEKMTDFKPTVSRAVFTVVLMVWSIFSLTGISTFLYFNF